MTAFTPGPWTVAGILPHGATHEIINADGPHPVAMVFPCTNPRHEGTCFDEASANARLIAAAPDLLEALLAIWAGFADHTIKWAKPRRDSSFPYHRANTLMCAALEKAGVEQEA